MPIFGLSESRRLPRVGKIHLGTKKTASNGKEYPSETDYFVVPPELAKLLGTDKPKVLSIMFPVEEPDIFFQQWYKCYGSSTLLKCKGDGVSAFTYDSTASGLVEVKCPCDKLESKECRRIATLQFLMPDVPGAGVWQITTSSINSILNINSSITLIRAVAGRVRMIPLLLKRKEVVMQRIENGTQKKSTHYILHLDVDDNMSLRQLQVFAQNTPETMLLPPPDETKDDLYFPANGYAPEDEKKVTKETSSEIIDPLLEQLKSNLVDVMADIEKHKIKLTTSESTRLSQITSNPSMDGYKKAIAYFVNKLNTLTTADQSAESNIEEKGVESNA